MATSTYMKFQRAVEHLSRRKGYDTGRLLRLADRYGYEAFANLAPPPGGGGGGGGGAAGSGSGGGSSSGPQGDTGGLGRSPGTNAPVQVMAPVEPVAVGPPKSAQGFQTAASGGQLAAGVATGNPGLAISGAVGTAKGLLGLNKPDLDTSPVDEAELGPELRLMPESAKSDPKPDSTKRATIDELITMFVDYMGWGPVFERLLRCYGHWERGSSKGWLAEEVPEGTRESIWASMKDIAYQVSKAHPSVPLMWMVYSGLVEYSSDAACVRNDEDGHGCVWRGLFGPIVRAIDEAHTKGPLQKDPGRYRTSADDAAMWVTNRTGRMDPVSGEYVESGDWLGTRDDIVRNLVHRVRHNPGNTPGWAYVFETKHEPDAPVGKLIAGFGPQKPITKAPPPGWGRPLAGKVGQHVQNKITKSVRQLSTALNQLGL